MLVFLGNPGSTYAKNRHNAGRLLAEHFQIPVMRQNKFKGRFAGVPLDWFTQYECTGGKSCSIDMRRVHIYFLEPETYMNLSGESVALAAAFYKISPERILVVHDELDLALGEVSLKFSGGLGGHNGLRSIKASLGSADFWRLRIGIGRPPGEKGSADVSRWVLSDFAPGEQDALEKVFDICAPALAEAVVSGPECLLPEWRKIKIVPYNIRGLCDT